MNTLDSNIPKATSILIFLGIFATRLATGVPGDIDKFKAFIESPPIISKVVYVHYYPGRTNHFPPIYTLARWQPDAFFTMSSASLEDILEPPTPDRTWHAKAASRFNEKWWTLEGDQRVLAVWDQKNNPDEPGNRVTITTLDALYHFSPLLNMGVDHANIGTIRWIGDGFNCTNEDRGTWHLAGRLRPDAEGRAGQLDLKLVVFEPQNTEPRSWNWAIDYHYETPLPLSYLPSRIVTRALLKEGERNIGEYAILELATTNQPLSESLFDSGMFHIPLSTVFVVTNHNVMYFEHGVWQAMWDPNDRRIVSTRPNTSKHLRLTYIVLTVVLFSPLLIAVWSKYLRRTPPTTTR